MAALRARGGAKNRHGKLKIAAEIEWKNTVSCSGMNPLHLDIMSVSIGIV